MKTYQLSERWADFLVNQPETGMGYWIVTVKIKNKFRYDRVIIVGGEITQVYGYDKIPFNADDITEMTVTHDKWKQSFK